MTSRSHAVVFLFATMFLAVAALAATNQELDATLSQGGLQKVKHKGLDSVYRKPDVNLAGYSKIRLDPVEVAFAHGWNPEKTGTRFKLTEQERNDLAAGVARNLTEGFARELQAGSRYQLVNSNGTDVLRIKARIVDLIVNAPDVAAPGRTLTYTRSTGSMTLIAELSDSQSGEVLARVADHHESRDNQIWKLTNSVLNDAEVRDAAAQWANVLRKALDKAHAIGKMQH